MGWVDALSHAAERNVELYQGSGATAVLIGNARTPAALDRIVSMIPYRFDGRAHVTAAIDEIERRGYAACTDAVALVLAWAVLHRVPPSRVWIGIEEHQEVRDYAHVLVRVQGVEVDPFRLRSLVAGRVRWVPFAAWPSTHRLRAGYAL